MRVLKTVFFHILMTVRRPILWVCRILGGLMLIGFVFLLFAGNQIHWLNKVMMFAFAVGFGATAFYYDQLILKLRPENTDLVLFS